MNRSALLMLPALLSAVPAQACTLWASVTPGGVLLAKNRDWAPDHVQSLRLLRPTGGLAYLGLFADSGRMPGIKAGVNEAGLTVVTAAASGLPRALRDDQPGRQGRIAQILRQSRTVENVVDAAPALFGSARAGFYLIADAREILLVEVGTEGRYRLTQQQQGSLAHTNHYFDAALTGGLDKPGASSVQRLQRIRQLLAETAAPPTLDDFGRFARDSLNGPDNSLWRQGREVTLARWQIALPAGGGPELRVWLDNPGQAEVQQNVRLDATFWQRPAGRLSFPPQKASVSSVADGFITGK